MSNIYKVYNIEKTYNFYNNKQSTNNSQHNIGSHEKQQLLFTLVYLILCYV
jgi:hypothetical protein